jgi:hypothetical protein
LIPVEEPSFELDSLSGDVFGPYGIGNVERSVGVSFASNE